eukprot:scaffold48587_cov43-Tisochrysis_lutea.AAC.1
MEAAQWCEAGVAGCGGGEGEAGVCLMCAHIYSCVGVASALLDFVEQCIRSDRAVLDDSGPLSPAAARRAAADYVESCGQSMDPTGQREWDCSRMLTSFLIDADGCAAVGITPTPHAVLELGAGAGSLALSLTADPGFSSRLELYVATDVAGRVEGIQRRLTIKAASADGRPLSAHHRSSSTLCAMPLQWGRVLVDDESVLGARFDLILLCELLYYKGSDDLLTPLVTTLASACRHGAMAVVVYRERCEEYEAAFFAHATDRGLVAREVHARDIERYTPPRRDGHGGPIRMVLMQLDSIAGE